MKKAVIVGGSNGIGLAISKALIDKDFFVEVIDCSKGDIELLPKERYNYTFCNLLDFEDELFENLAQDSEIEVLFITAGIGRVAEFYAHHVAEINNMIAVDTIAPIRIIKAFYNRIMNNAVFYTGIMGSISGWVCSPATSVYAAAKAALVRFVESVNIELEVHGTSNRILDVSPGSFKGSHFNGGPNNLSLLEDLSGKVIHRLFNRETLFIPEYEDIYKRVIDQYHEDPHAYGIHSYNYKVDSGRLNNQKKCIIGYLSGTFDLFHIGHLNLLRRAKQNCDYLIVGVHSDGKWKGKETFIPLDERKAILRSCKYVDKVVDSCPEDSDAWEIWHYDRLFVGSDYKGTERFIKYEQFFENKGVEIIYFPYTKSTSSTQLRNAILNNKS